MSNINYMAGIAGAGKSNSDSVSSKIITGDWYMVNSPVKTQAISIQDSWQHYMQSAEEVFSNWLSTLLLATLLILGSIYMLPSIIVLFNKRKAVKSGVILLNIFLGWTFIGWIIALIIALQTDTILIYTQPPSTKL